MSSRIKRQARPQKFADRVAAMKGRGAHSASIRAKTGKAKVTLAKAPDGKQT